MEIAPRNVHSFILDFNRSNEKNAVKHALADFVMHSNHSFRSVESKEFLNLAQAFVDIGATKGKVNAEKILVARKTVKECVMRKVQSIKEKLKEGIKEHKEFVSVKNDIFTEKFTGISLMAFTVFYIVEDFCFHSQLYDCAEFVDAHTAHNIRNKIQNYLAELQLSEEQTPFTTDCAANVSQLFPLHRVYLVLFIG